MPAALLGVGVALLASGVGHSVPLIEATVGSPLGEAVFLILGGLLVLVALQAALESPSPAMLILLTLAIMVLMPVGDLRWFTLGVGHTLYFTAVGIVLFLVGIGLAMPSVAPATTEDFLEPVPGAQGGPARTPFLMYLVFAVLLGGGVVFVVAGLGNDPDPVELTLEVPWARWVFLITGAALLYLGIRGAIRAVRAARGRPEAGKRSAVRAAVAPVAGILAVGVLLFHGSLQGVEVGRGGWFLWLFAAVCALLTAFDRKQVAATRDLEPEPAPTPDVTATREPAPSGPEPASRPPRGIRGRAEILDFEDTNVTVGSREEPRVRLRLRVELEGHEPYEADRLATVPRLSIGRLLKGASLPVVADPADPAKIKILWKEP